MLGEEQHILGNMAPKMDPLLTKFGVVPTDMSPCLKHFGSVSSLLEVNFTIIPRRFSKDSMGGTNTAGGVADDTADYLNPTPVRK